MAPPPAKWRPLGRLAPDPGCVRDTPLLAWGGEVAVVGVARGSTMLRGGWAPAPAGLARWTPSSAPSASATSAAIGAARRGHLRARIARRGRLTAGIFSRPSCSSRVARSCREAERAGGTGAHCPARPGELGGVAKRRWRYVGVAEAVEVYASWRDQRADPVPLAGGAVEDEHPARRAHAGGSGASGRPQAAPRAAQLRPRRCQRTSSAKVSRALSSRVSTPLGCPHAPRPRTDAAS